MISHYYRRSQCYTLGYFTKKSISFELPLIFRYHWVMKFSQKIFVKFCKNKDLWALEKKERFRLLFNLETLKIQLWRDSNPRPWASQSVTLPTIPNFLMKFFSKFLSQMLKDFYNLSVAESPVGSSSNRRFRLKRQKTRTVHIFWHRSYICMKLLGCMSPPIY